jgi:hypothetical protein
MLVLALEFSRGRPAQRLRSNSGRTTSLSTSRPNAQTAGADQGTHGVSGHHREGAELNTCENAEKARGAPSRG